MPQLAESDDIEYYRAYNWSKRQEKEKLVVPGDQSSFSWWLKIKQTNCVDSGG